MKDLPVIYHNKAIRKLATKTGRAERDVRNACRDLMTYLTLQQDCERELNALKNEYGQKGLEFMMSECMSQLTKPEVEEMPV